MSNQVFLSGTCCGSFFFPAQMVSSREQSVKRRAPGFRSELTCNSDQSCALRDATFRKGAQQMLRGWSVLIADDEVVTALDLAAAVTREHGHVLGPVSTLSQGIRMASAGLVHGAIVDVNLLDGQVTALAHILLRQGALVVFHSVSPVPREISTQYRPVVHCLKPMAADHVVAHLIEYRLAGPVSRRHR